MLLLSRPDAGNHALKAIALLAALVYFCAVEPADRVLCPLRWLTGLPCMLCGMTRALSALGHGHFRRAVELHAISPLIFTLFVAGFVGSIARLCGWSAPRLNLAQPRAFAGLLVLLFGYWVWRLVFGITATL